MTIHHKHSHDLLAVITQKRSSKRGRGASFSSQWWISVTANEEKEVCGVNEATPVEQKLLPRKIASLHDMVKEAMKEQSRMEVQATRQRVASGGRRRYGP